MQLQIVGGQAAEDQHQIQTSGRWINNSGSVHSVTVVINFITTDYHFHVLVKNNEGEWGAAY